MWAVFGCVRHHLCEYSCVCDYLDGSLQGRSIMDRKVVMGAALIAWAAALQVRGLFCCVGSGGWCCLPFSRRYLEVNLHSMRT